MWESDRQTESDTTGASCLSQSPFSTANTTHHLQEEVFCLRATSSDTEGGGDPNESCHSVERGALSTGTGKLWPWGQMQLIMLFNWLAKLGRNGISRKHCQTRNWIMQLQNMNLVVWSCFLALHKIYAILLQKKKQKHLYTACQHEHINTETNCILWHPNPIDPGIQSASILHPIHRGSLWMFCLRHYTDLPIPEMPSVLPSTSGVSPPHPLSRFQRHVASIVFFWLDSPTLILLAGAERRRRKMGVSVRKHTAAEGH